MFYILGEVYNSIQKLLFKILNNIVSVSYLRYDLRYDIEENKLFCVIFHWFKVF